MAGFTLNWQDFMKRTETKALLEEKGMVAVKQKYMQEQNKLMWHDPVILNENRSPGQSVTTNNSADGNPTQFITGHVAEISNVTWTHGNFTASNAPTFEAQNYFDIQGIKVNTSDWSYGHKYSRYNYRCYLTTGSKAPLSLPAGYEGVITSSVQVNALPTPDNSCSFLNGMKDAINNQLASVVIGGVTNGAMAPSTLFTATLSADSSSLTIANDNKGAVQKINLSYTNTVSGSLAKSTTTKGTDTYHYNPGVQTFLGNVPPYSSMPRK